MPLPVLPADAAMGAEDLVRQAGQVQRQWSEHLVNERLIDTGRVFASAALSTVADANCVLDPAVSSIADMGAAIADVETAFAAAGSRCLRWTLPAGPSAIAWEDRLQEQGFAPVISSLFRLRQVRSSTAAAAAALKIIPARAALGGYAAFVEQMHGGPVAAADQAAHAGQEAEAALLHLDDGHYDVLVAMEEGRVIGSVGIFSMGQIGAIRELRVLESRRTQGIGRLLLDRALQSCARSLFRHVLASVDAPSTAAERLLHGAGFVEVGPLRRLERR